LKGNSNPMFRKAWLVAMIAAVLVMNRSRAADDVATNLVTAHPDGGMFMICPAVGFDRNEYSSPDPLTGQNVAHKNTAGEYALMASYVDSRVAVNNILFYTNPNDSKVWGDIFALSVNGDPKEVVTWAAGGSYTWHEIEMPGMSLRINEPLVRVGPLFRVPSCNLALNPYVGYARLMLNTTYGNDAWNTSVLGAIARWDWRMVHVFGQYYLQDNPELDQVYQVFRARQIVFVTEHWGLMAREEYMRQYTSKDTSLLFGVVYLF